MDGAAIDQLTIVRWRLHDQRLAGRRFAQPADVVQWLGAMQAQEYAEAKWSIGERAEGCTDADVESAFGRGDILRTHVLRPTWHFVTPSDIRWLLRLTAPRVHQVNRYWCAKFGLDAAVLTRATRVVVDEIGSHGPRTRVELGAALAARGIDVAGLGLGYMLMHAELELQVCSGPRRARQHTYALLADRAPLGIDGDLDRRAALGELVLRYFRSHGPATAKDLANWATLTLADVKDGLDTVGDQLERQVADDGRAWFSDPHSTAGGAVETGAFLIPSYDETVTYKQLRIVLDTAPPAGSLARPIVIDGRTVGSWSRTLSPRAVVVHATSFRPLTATEIGGLHAVTDRFGRFLQLPATLDLRSVLQIRPDAADSE